MVTGISRSGGLIAGFFLGTLLLYQTGLQAAASIEPDAVASIPNAGNSSQSTRSSQARSRKQEILKQVPRYAPDRVLVRFRPGTAASEAGKAHRQAGGRKLREIPGIGVHVVQVPAGSVQRKVASYQSNPNVEYAEPDFYRVLIVPDEGNDPGPGSLTCGVVEGRDYFEEQWGLNNTGQEHTVNDPIFGPGQVTGTSDADIDAPEGWDITTGDPAVKIAILDTGIDCGSVEHAGKCVEQVSFVTNYSDNLDDIAQHGTHVAGIAAVHTDNGIGVSGVGWNSSVGNLKTCFEYWTDLLPPLGLYGYLGVCPVSASAAAITYAADNNYHVINMSYGSDQLDPNGDPSGVPAQPNAETDAINYAWNHGVVLVAAAGNDANMVQVFPAAHASVVAVAGTDHHDDKWWKSTFDNSWVSLMAPSENILSTVPVESCVFFADLQGCPFDPATDGCLTWNSGTSMASPHVAGAAALVWAHLFPGQTPSSCVSPSGVPCNDVVRHHLEYGADTDGALGQNFLAWSQHGRLNVHGALSIVDTDLDGLPDSVDSDDDNDGLDDDFETSSGIGTDPLDADSDDDGLSDGAEVNYDATSPNTYLPGQDTDPLDPDTDDDGFLDGMEVAAGHDPLLAGDAPVWGDADGNGIVNAADVLLLTRGVLGLHQLEDDQKARVDIAPVIAGVPSPDNQLTAGDLVVVEQILLGQASYP